MICLFFLPDLGYATQVIQQAKPKGGLVCQHVLLLVQRSFFLKE